MDAVTIATLVGGGVLLIVGAELLVRGASRIAQAAGITPLVVGLTVVAFGTSSPELAVSVQAALTGQPGIAVGNVVGSNIFNILLILGLSAAIAPLVVSQQVVRLDVPVMIAVSLLFLLLALDGRIGTPDGVLLFAGVLAYTGFLIRQSRRETAAIRAEYDEAFAAPAPRGARWALDIGSLLAGLALLALGSRLLVNAAVAIATAFGVSDLVIGLTIVAAGTSLPEVATSVLATIRGERDIAVGNVVGSNIFNILSILGLTAIVAPGGIPIPRSALAFDIPIMIAIAVATLPVVFTGYLIARWEGFLFLAYYGAYTLYLVLTAREHAALPFFSDVMLLFVIPITAVTLVLLAVRAARAG